MIKIDKQQCIEQINALPRTTNNTLVDARICVGCDSDPIRFVVIRPVEVKKTLRHSDYHFVTLYDSTSEIPETERIAATQEFDNADDAFSFITRRAATINDFFNKLNAEVI